MSVKEVFSEKDLKTLREATRAAEARTSGEIVTVVVESCDTYEGALWKSAALGSLIVALATGLLHSIIERWSFPGWVWMALPAFAGAALGFLLPLRSPAVHRWLVGRRILETRAARRAAAAFVDEEVFATRDRSGVLIFVGLFEHRVEVLRDTEAQQRVPRESWDDLVDRLASRLRKGEVADGLAQAIEDSGRLLELHGLARRPDDTDELSDEVRLHDE